MSNQADAHFAGWLICPVCKKETRHYTKDTHESPVAKIRRIWCEDCRVVHMQFKQVAENENNLKIIECFACKDEGARKFLVCYLRWDHMDYYLKTWLPSLRFKVQRVEISRRILRMNKRIELNLGGSRRAEGLALGANYFCI